MGIILSLPLFFFIIGQHSPNLHWKKLAGILLYQPNANNFFPLWVTLQHPPWSCLDLCYLKRWDRSKQPGAGLGCLGLGLGSSINAGSLLLPSTPSPLPPVPCTGQAQTAQLTASQTHSGVRILFNFFCQPPLPSEWHKCTLQWVCETPESPCTSPSLPLDCALSFLF